MFFDVGIVALALTLGVAALYLGPGALAGLLWALLPLYGSMLPAGTGLVVCALGMAIIAVRCAASSNSSWRLKSTGLLVALAAGLLVAARKYADTQAFTPSSLAMPLAIAISLFILYIGLSAVGRVGLLRGIIAGVTLVSLAEVLRVAQGGPIHPAEGAFGINPITIGQYATLGILLSLFLIRLNIARAVHGITLLVCASGLAITNSRGPFLGLGVALLLMYVAGWLKTGRKMDYRLRLLIPVTGLIAGILVVNAALTQFYSWFRTSDEDGNASGRLGAWSKAVESIIDSPFLGQGAGRYNMGDVGPASGLSTFPHNIYLEIWAEYGLVPFALLAVAAVLIIRGSGTAGRPIVVGFLLCYSVSGSLDTSLGLWVALAVALTLSATNEATPRQQHEQAQEQEPEKEQQPSDPTPTDRPTGSPAPGRPLEAVR